MKRIISLLITLCSLAAMGQYPVSSISITIANNPPANTADWVTAMPPLMITAQAKLVQGKMDPRVQESRILVTIKNGSNKICGSFTQQTAPLSSFNSATKNWSGAVAVGLLGNGCILKPGTYELCVQFFSTYAPIEALSTEMCKSFTIADIKQQSYSAPQNMIPPDGKVISNADANQPVMFRWLGVMPKPTTDVIYKLRIVEVKADQSSATALRQNTPIAIIEVKNLTQTSYKLAQRYNGLVWDVEAFSTERTNGEPSMHGRSEATTITFKKSDEDAKLKELKNYTDTTDSAPPINVQPADGKAFTKLEIRQAVQLRWIHIRPRPPVNEISYIVRVYVVEKGQSSSQAIKNNRPVFEKTVKTKETTWQMPNEYANSKETKTFVWNVRATNKEGKAVGKNNGTSEATSFDVRSANCLMTPTLIETSCISTTATTKTIRVKIKIENSSSSTDPAIVYLNHSNTINHVLYSSLGLNPGNLIQGKDDNFTPSPGVNSVIAFNPATYPTQIPSSSFIIQEVDVNINNSVTSFHLLVLTTSRGQNPGDALVPCYEDIVIDSIPECPCTFCDRYKDWMFGQENVTAASTTGGRDIINVATSITAPSISIISFKAELVTFIHNGIEQCFGCNKDPQTFGNFTGGIFGAWGNGVFPLDGSNTTHHTLSWFSASGGTTQLSGSQLHLSFTTPPLSPLKCCDDEIKFCIRYSFTTKDCKTCSFLKCYTIKRKH